LVLVGPGRLLGQAVNEQDQLDFGRLSLAVGSGARALGMGGAFLARPDDATAASWNPAGLSYLRFAEVSIVGVSYSQDVTVRSADSTLLRVEDTKGKVPDFLSLAVPLSAGAASGAVQLSFQRVIAYTGDRTIDQLGDPPRTVEVRGGFDVLALSTGLKVAPWLRAGVSVNRWMNGFTQHLERLERRRSLQDADFRLSGWSVNAGLIVHPHETLNLGLVGKTHMTGGVELQRSRTDIFPNSPEPVVVTHNSFRSDDVRLDLPGAVGFGASWRASSVLTLSSDYTVTFWSHARIRNYFTLSATPDLITTPPAATIFTSLPFPSLVNETETRSKAQTDTNELRVGLEYVVIAGRIKLPLRAGYVREKRYQLRADGTAPRLDSVTVGAGLVLGPVLLDAAYLYSWGEFGPPEERDTRRLHRALVSVIYRHGSGT
jgi:long-subunit fatty acid transport protein